MKFETLHNEAIKISRNYSRAEAELLDVLQRIDAVKAFRDYGCPSLFQYTVQVLKLSEAVAYTFINVARKAAKVPELKAAIETGTLSVSKARKIVSVLDEGASQESQREWIEKAKTLPSKKLEQEVAKVSPQELTPESARFVTETRRALKLGMNEADFQNLKRVQDLESQRQKKAVSMEVAITVLTRFYLEAKDPLKKAERVLSKSKNLKNSKYDLFQNWVVTTQRDSEKQAKPGSRINPLEKHDSQNPHILVTRTVAPVTDDETLEIPPDFFRGFHVNPPRTPIPARLMHQVNLRDETHCTHRNAANERCDQKRWLQIHHLKPVSQGGSHKLTNLTTLCSSHHRQRHVGNGMSDPTLSRIAASLKNHPSRHHFTLTIPPPISTLLNHACPQSHRSHPFSLRCHSTPRKTPFGSVRKAPHSVGLRTRSRITPHP